MSAWPHPKRKGVQGLLFLCSNNNNNTSHSRGGQGIELDLVRHAVVGGVGARVAPGDAACARNSSSALVWTLGVGKEEASDHAGGAPSNRRASFDEEKGKK